MDKQKLIQIIEKELDELKVLSEEVAENENDTALIVELALSKARLLCQEFELLRELTSMDIAIPTDDLQEENQLEEEDDEVSEVSVSDPELEIVNFEESESEEVEESDEEVEKNEDQVNMDNESEEDDFQEDIIDPEESEEEPEVDEVEGEVEMTDEDLTDDEDQDENNIDFIEEEIEEEGLIEFGENNNDIEESEIENPQPSIEISELKTDLQPDFREINIEDMDDGDLEHIKITPESNVVDRPIMREIPKPEELIQEKTIIGEQLPKDRTLNDTISETKSTEPPLTNISISSLRTAIGLNDRFLFIREIFGNNTDKYNTIIDQLDKLETQQQAVELLKANLTLEKNETSMKFVELLKRRFSK